MPGQGQEPDSGSGAVCDKNRMREGSEERRQPPKTPTVLIVEDDREIREELKWALRADDRVKDASDRASALAALRRDAPVVVVLDLGLPPQRRVASEGRRTLGDLIRLKPGMKVIAVTGNGDRSRWGVSVAIVCALTFLPLLQDAEAVPITVEQIFCEQDKRVACSVLSGATEASLLEMSAMDFLRIELPGTSSPPGGAASVNLPTGAASPVPFPFSGESVRDAAKPIFRDEGTSGAGRALQ